MSLLTPPHSSHRSDKDKENKFSAPLAGPSTRSVIWASENSIHSLSTPPKPTTISSKHRPKATKSILKKSSQDNTLLMVPEVTEQRETTPEPADPLVNLHYLDHPVAQILSNESSDEKSLRELIEGYNVLAARLRSTVTDSTDADASWPLFQPLRKNTQSFVDAIVRDVGRALIDPLSYQTEDDATGVPKFTLPSPQKSPAKKKGGLTAEQVKYARDLCTVCHSVIKLLSVVLSVPALFSIFEEKQLCQMLTAILAIPLAEELPTPNARKTCALAIWLIQVQRLPEAVLRPAADRIAYALRRGLDGELGKEGKKGSANDGLKAIHDLCAYLPAVFVPAFTPLLPSVLSNLLASTFNLRTQACHALGGFVNGSTAIPLSAVHTRIANTVASYLTIAPPPSTKSPTKQPTEALILRTLRTTLGCVDPVHVAQGPAWGLSVLASFVVLLRSRLCMDARVNRILSSLLGLGMQHKKSSVRALCCVVWRAVTWVYFQPPLPITSEDEDEKDATEAEKVSPDQVRKVHLKVVMSVVEMQTGVSTIAALLGDENATGEEPLNRCLEILQNMATKPQPTCADAIEAMRQMTTLPSSGREDVDAWDASLLLPKGLFSSNPGLLTAEFKNLSTAVRPLFDQVATFQDIRYLTREEMSRPWVFNGLLHSWKIALGNIDMFDESEVPENLMEIWTNLLNANIGRYQEDGDDTGASQFAFNAVLHLVDIAQDPILDLRPKKVPIPIPANDGAPGSDDTIPDVDGLSSCDCTNSELRLRVIQRLWTVMKTLIPHNLLEQAADKLIDSLLESRKSLVPEGARLDGYTDEDAEGPRNAWISLCMDVLSICDVEMFKVFWSCETDLGPDVLPWTWTRDFTRAIWKASAEKWVEGEGHWEAGVILLGLPFSDRHAWNPASEDYNTWEDILTYTTSKALDHGFDTAHVLDSIANFVAHFQTPGLHPAPSTRLVDLLLSHIDFLEMRDLPIQAIELASVTMRATYPPEPRNTPVAMWMVRSLMTVIEHCPPELCLRLLHTLDDGLSLWLADECDAWSNHELNYDIIPLYQHILVRIQALSESSQTLQVLENILASVFTKRVLPPAVEAFTDYWNLTYSRLPLPEKGWSDVITDCLRAVGILSKPSNDEGMDNIPASPLAPAFVIPLSSPRTPVASSFSTPPTAIIKREALSKLPSPQRPQKVFGSFPIVPSTPLSPIRRRSTSSSSTRRTPLSSIQLRGSPSKRRRVMAEDDSDKDEEEKENLLAGRAISVAVRIAELKPNAKKRRHEDDEEQKLEPSPMKKLKGKMKPKSKSVSKKSRPSSPAPSAASSSESGDERREAVPLVASFPFPSTEPTDNAPDVCAESVAGPSRERGDCTVVSLVEARAQHASMDHQFRRSQRIDLTKVPIRRSVSNPESLLATVSNKKRKRVSLAEGDQDLYDASTSDPLPALSLPRPRQVKRAITLPSSDADVSTAESSSSDDDPHLGQVTPHHLISPAIARRSHYGGSMTSKCASAVMHELFGDDIPASDDSTPSDTESESPTKEFVTRQLQKMGSESRFSKSLTT